MTTTSIEWTQKTWNPVRGCSRVSRGCEHCYAERVAARFAGEGGRFEGLVRLSKKHGPQWTGRIEFAKHKLDEPLTWREPRLVFVNSMSDLFHEGLRFEEIAAVFGVMAAAPRHTFQVLTKRPARALAFFEWLGPGALDRCACNADDALESSMSRAVRADHFAPRRGALSWPLPNVWLGVSVEDQPSADARIPVLLELPAAVRFVSYEPALGPVSFSSFIAPYTCCNGCRTVTDGDHKLCPACERDNAITAWGDDQLARWESGERYDANDGRGHDDLTRGPGLDWIIVGGESGPGARPFDVAWARSTIEQCRAAGVACFVKQLGDHAMDSIVWRSSICDAPPDIVSGGYVVGDWEPCVCCDDDRCVSQVVRLAQPMRVLLSSRKGGAPSEWPEDLRVRQWPRARTETATPEART